MKKTVVLAIFAFSILLLGFLLYILTRQNHYKDFKIMDYQLKSKNYRLLVADTPEKWTKGLMNFRKLDGVDGMIFLFPGSETRSFWNNNTFLDLEIYWIEGDKVVGKSSLPSIEKSKNTVIVDSPGAVNKVIEIVK